MNGIIFRGDDAGSCFEANRAIERCVREGVLRNVSVMVPGPALEDAVDRLMQLDGINIGLHVVLNSEWDLIKWGPVRNADLVPTLVTPAGAFTQSPKVLYDQGFSLDEAEAEVVAQIAQARALGLRLDYLDEHMGVGWLPGLRDRLHAIANREGLYIADKLNYLEPVADEPKDLAEAVVFRALQHPDPRVYVNHPGEATGSMELYHHEGLAPGQVARERQADADFYCSDELRQALEQAQIASLTYLQAAAILEARSPRPV